MEALLNWVQSHPTIALISLALACAVEAMFVIGIVIPGALILFGFGALVALGVLDLWVCILATTIGAIGGDLLTYWIGRRYGPSLFSIPLLARYPEAVARGQNFFRSHGGKSVILGRIIGPTRPLMPAIAGAYGMRMPIFIAFDAVGALAFSVIYLLPGVVFGASLSLAAEVATRMVVLLLAVVLGLWLIFWAAGRWVRYFQAHAEQWVVALLDWSGRHRRLGRLGSWLADPGQPETPALGIIALILMVGGWIAMSLWWGVGSTYPATYDALAYQTLRDLYTPVVGYMATAIALLGEAPVYIPVAIAVAIILVWRRRVRAAWHWLAAIGFGAVISLGLYYLLPLPDPQRYFGGQAATRFSGRDLVLATVIYGFIPVLLSTRRRISVRAWLYGVATAVLALIVAAQLYLGIQWPSVAIFSISIGIIWVTVLAIGYRRHRAERIIARQLLWPVLLVFTAAAALSWEQRLEVRVARYTPDQPTDQMNTQQWWEVGYSRLPAYRSDIAGRPEQPLNLQWAGELEEIEATLREANWVSPVSMNWANALRWLTATTPISTLPILPQVHAGRHQSLILSLPIDADQQWVIRLWATPWRVDQLPLWIGTVSRQQVNSLIRLLRYPATLPAFDQPPELLDISRVSGFDGRLVPHPQAQQATPTAGWSGNVWLLRPAPQS